MPRSYIYDAILVYRRPRNVFHSNYCTLTLFYLLICSNELSQSTLSSKKQIITKKHCDLVTIHPISCLQNCMTIPKLLILIYHMKAHFIVLAQLINEIELSPLL